MENLFRCIWGAFFAVALLTAVPCTKADDAAADGKDGKSARPKTMEERIHELEEKLQNVGYTGIKGSGIKLSGYVDTSYLVNLRGNNGSSPTAGAGGPAFGNSANFGNGRIFDVQQDEFTLHAVKLTLEKDKDDSDFPAGFRVDLLYGADANQLNNRGIATAFGARDNFENDSDFFLEQAYITLGLPVGDGVNVTIGKTVTLLGYEIIESPAQSNFSRSFGFGLYPFTQTGVVFGYQILDCCTVNLGMVNGVNDSDFGVSAVNGAGNSNTEFMGVGRADITSPDDWSASVGKFTLGIAGLFGNDSTVDVTAGVPGASGTNQADNGTSISMIDVPGTWTKVFGHEPLSLGFEFFMRQMDRRTVLAANNTREDDQDDTTAALYAKYQVTDWLYFAGRGEYWYADDRSAGAAGIFSTGPGAAPGLGTASGNHISVWEGTLTAGFNVWKDTLVRLEYRHDEVGGKDNGFINEQSLNNTGGPQLRRGQDTIAVNVAYSF